MAAITISRQLGSQGRRIARELAKKLDWQFTDKSSINKVISKYGLIRLDEIYGDEPPRFRELLQKDTMWTITWMNKTIATLAATRDVVILGRGGFAVLEGYADVLNVLVTAPLEDRIEFLADRDGTSNADARRRVESNDQAREVFVRRFYGSKWADESRYDLVINSSEMSEDEAIDTIIRKHAEHLASSKGKKVKGLGTDDVLLETIDEVLS